MRVGYRRTHSSATPLPNGSSGKTLRRSVIYPANRSGCDSFLAMPICTHFNSTTEARYKEFA